MDEDGDGFIATACLGLDCDDTDPAVYPRSGDDGCDGVDSDCDARVDENPDLIRFVDRDDDGFGGGTPFGGCAIEPDWSPIGGDCNDVDPAVHPGAVEVCDDRDTDCNSLLDGPDEDDDGDGWTDADCLGRTSYADCDDENPMAYWQALEPVCSTVDLDCDGVSFGDSDRDGLLSIYCGGTDCVNHDPSIGTIDEDHDGQMPIDGCEGGTDCDDTDPDVYGGAPELCNGVDESCDGLAEDFDRDGYASVGALCRDDLPGSLPRTDCDDSNRDRHPGASELCNGANDDCDPSTPDGSSPGACPVGTSCIDGVCG